MIGKQIWLCALLCAVFAGASSPARAMTNDLTITGRLLDANGNPILYQKYVPYYGLTETSVSLKSQIKFYATETTTTCIYTINTYCHPHSGYFEFTFQLPWSVLAVGELWYSLSIDADQNGLTSSDLFASRFRIGAVPFALSTKPTHAFTTHGGQSDNAVDIAQYEKVMVVAPFDAPAGGVEFNTMSIPVAGMPDGGKLTFGIYDVNGNLVVQSGRIDMVGASISDAFLEIKLPQTVKLEPNAVYYTAWARNMRGIYFHPGLKPARPIFGYVAIPQSDGTIPSSFNPDTIDCERHCTPLVIDLTFETRTPSMATAGLNAGKPQVRWIYTKDTKVVTSVKK